MLDSCDFTRENCVDNVKMWTDLAIYSGFDLFSCSN